MRRRVVHLVLAGAVVGMGISASPLHGQALPELPLCPAKQGFTGSFYATGEWGLKVGSHQESGPLGFGDDDSRESQLWDVDHAMFDPGDHGPIKEFLQERLSEAATKDWTRAVLTIQCTDSDGKKWNVQYEATRQTHELIFGRFVPSDVAMSIVQKSAVIIE